MQTSKIYNSVIGKSGEDKACEHLKTKGYKILKRNFSTKLGELDIIALDKNIIVFIEVKTRKNDYFGLPREAVTLSKQRKIRMVATQYLKYTHSLEKPCRFDVIDILGDTITHLINCF